MSSIQTHNLGYPRIGEKRELKRATEAYWKGGISADDLNERAREIRRIHWKKQKDLGVQGIPSNDFSFYDQVLDMSCLLGNVPDRFEWDHTHVDLDLMFQIARGTGDAACSHHASGHACEMTKWFNTNYHYIVPEFHQSTTFRISTSKVFDEFNEAKELGIITKPVLIGPFTYLTLGKSTAPHFDRYELLTPLTDVYIEILKRLAAQGARMIQLDEPVLAGDLDEREQSLLSHCYERIAKEVPEAKILLATYFGDLQDNLPCALNLPVSALHLDVTDGPQELESILSIFPKDKTLSLGVISGRNIWRTDLHSAFELVQTAVSKLGEDRVMLAPSCSLLHVPITLAHERKIEVHSWMAFADEKLKELEALRQALIANTSSTAELVKNAALLQSMRLSPLRNDPKVQARVATIQEDDVSRPTPFAQRQAKQKERLKLPAFPTTTIGSFPQTEEIRKARSAFRRGEWTLERYEGFLEKETEKCVKLQEEIGLDMLVHGEFERNDMVEYFGEQLDGFAFTRYGWVQSYGTRYVKPPIIFGDVSRPHPMTLRWSQFAQSLTQLPMKGMLTGPVTILQWSFVRNDQPRSQTAMQIALAIRDEVKDLEASGLAAIQIDEPALREGLPLRRADWNRYLDWAVRAFRLASSGVRDDTQIHTHMCYAEFNDIIESIAALDADVITIETARSNFELLDAFAAFHYPNEIGPGVYDIHSPSIPDITQIEHLLHRAAELIPPDNLWVNPDCGLKTRNWNEVTKALGNMVAAAKTARSQRGG